jgi:hypothetical protein
VIVDHVIVVCSVREQVGEAVKEHLCWCAGYCCYSGGHASQELMRHDMQRKDTQRRCIREAEDVAVFQLGSYKRKRS